MEAFSKIAGSDESPCAEGNDCPFVKIAGRLFKLGCWTDPH